MILRMLTTRNVGTADRILRTLPAILVALAWTSGWIGGWTAGVLAVVAGMLVLTSLLGSCSIYYMLGYSTCPISGEPRPKA
jgi:hypothetical protein